MSDTAIRAEGLGKQYRIRRAWARYRSLRESLTDGVADMLGRVRLRGNGNGRRRQPDELFWALKDVSLEIRRGDVTGVIGHNGAGKSTLLKILSRVTVPTTGYAEIHGRMGSLLEVGIGFHPELTGTENIYLSGAILGMKRAEIDRRFDEIVDFAEIERFLEMPVKHYSHGMYLRLAFAVAAHFDTEILLVDEVLAVGDAAFQKKCLGRIGDVARQGRTVLLVSHNMDAIQRLCLRSLLLERGQLVAYGPSPSIVSRYLSRNRDKSGPGQWIDVSGMQRIGRGEARFLAVRYSSLEETVAYNAYPEGPLEFTFVIESDSARSVASLAATIYDQHGTKLINADTISCGAIVHLQKGRNTVGLRIESLHLNPGLYVVGLWLADGVGDAFDFVRAAFETEVVPARSQGFGSTPTSNGLVSCRFELLENP